LAPVPPSSVPSVAARPATSALVAPPAGRVRRVVLLGPSHGVPLDGLPPPSADAFATPLGSIPLDREALAALAALALFLGSASLLALARKRRAV
jgi:AmmeMemoRadiSam system protein B